MFQGRISAPGNGWIERRDQRHKVLLRTRMRAGGLPVDVCVCDVSPRGICAMTAFPPPRGTYVELTDLAWPVVGEVAWSSQRRFGIAVGERIDLKRLLVNQSSAVAERRQLHAPSQKPEPGARGQRARETGQTLQFAFVAVSVAIAALLIGEFVYSQLSQAVAGVTGGLGARR